MNPEKGSYAILSHTWGPDEVPFQKDLTSAKWMQEFAKIEKTYELAKEGNIQYAWVDTCCIDKSSSAELSEAINSMFRWYQEAAVCFAVARTRRPRRIIRWWRQGDHGRAVERIQVDSKRVGPPGASRAEECRAI